MELRQLTQGAFIALLILVGILLLVNLPPLSEVGTTPSSDVVTFEIDHWVTELHRNLKRAHYAEVRGDNAGVRNDVSPVDDYQMSLRYFRRARHFAEKYRTGGYIDRLIDRRRSRLKRKIRQYKRSQ